MLLAFFTGYFLTLRTKVGWIKFQLNIDTKFLIKYLGFH